MRLRSLGVTLDNCQIVDNMNAGVHFDPSVDRRLQRDIVTWLYSRKDAWESRCGSLFILLIACSNVYAIPNRNHQRIRLSAATDNSLVFLVARAMEDGDGCERCE